MKKKIPLLLVLLAVLAAGLILLVPRKSSNYNKYKAVVETLKAQKGIGYTKKSSLTLTIGKEAHSLTQTSVVVKNREGSFKAESTLSGMEQQIVSTSFYQDGFYYENSNDTSFAYPISFRNSQEALPLREYLSFTEEDVQSSSINKSKGEAMTLYLFNLKEEYGQKYLTQAVTELLGNRDIVFTQTQEIPLQYDIIVNAQGLPVTEQLRFSGTYMTDTGSSTLFELVIDLNFTSYEAANIVFPSDLNAYPLVINHQQLKEFRNMQSFIQQFI